MDDCAFWKQWIDEVKYDLQVVPGKLENLHKKYSAQIIAMDHLYPMTDVKKTLSNCLYAFKTGHPISVITAYIRYTYQIFNTAHRRITSIVLT
jgi:hypothetical protein